MKINVNIQEIPLWMLQRALLSFFILSFCFQSTFAQQLTLKGKVIDRVTKQPISYANAEAWGKDSVLITAAATDQNGKFKLTVPNGKNPFLKIRFIGYHSTIVKPLYGEKKSEIVIPDILLQPDAALLNEVSVQGQNVNNRVQLDKQVFSAKQFQTAQNGTGLELLQKLSSVTVTNEGEIALRGSTGFIVFINGKRSNRAPADVLAQLPANNIESVEILTSPSAKYDAEGKTGIINIVTKKPAEQGLSVSGNSMFAGTSPQRYGGDLMFTYGAPKWTVYAGGDGRRYDFNGRRVGQVRTAYKDTVTSMPSDGARNFMEYQYSFRAGASFTPSLKDIFNISLYAGKKESDRTANLHYNEYTKAGSTNLYDNNFTNPSFNFYNHNLFARSGEFKTIDLDYTHTYADKSKLSFLSLYEHSVLGGPLNNQDFYEGGGALFQNEYSNERSPLDGIRLQADYTLPLTKNLKLSTGYQFRSLKESGYFTYERMDTTTNGAYYRDPGFNDTIRLKQQLHAGYVQFDGENANFSYSFGLRAEYMNRTLVDQLDPENYTYNKLNWFPSAQALWKLSGQQKFRLGYSRRIDWPNAKSLSPFKNHRHEETIETGDPNLRPEISNILEAGYSKSWDRLDLTATAYYNKVQDRVFRINDIYSRTILLRGYSNAGNAVSAGTQIDAALRLTSAWRFNVSANLYNFSVTGSYKNYPVDQGSFNYNGNASTTLDVGKRLKFQWDCTYVSRSVTSQGHDSQLFLSNAGGRYSIWNKKGYLGLQVNNIFNTNDQTIINQEANFYTSTRYVKYDRALQLSFGWQINDTGKKAKSLKTDYGEKEF